MDKQIILEKAKKGRYQRYLSNCYHMDDIDRAEKLWEKGESFVFSYTDHGIKRLIFSAADWHTVDELLSSIDAGTYYLEYMTKQPQEYVPVHSSLTARMARIANADCRSVFDTDSPVLQYQSHSAGVWAGEEDAGEINRILWSVFHTEVSHLLYDDELKEIIQRKQIMIARENEQITALLQAEVLPKKFYINQIVNRGDRKIIHGMLLRQLEEYVKAGGKYLYAWVDETNIASLKFHHKYGMEKDGTYSEIYCIERP